VQKVELKELKHVETVDKAGPVIDKNTHVKKSQRPKLLKEVQSFQGHAVAKAAYEKKIEEQTQAREQVFDGIKHEHKLKHVETVDKAKPQVEAVKVRKNEHNKLLDEVQHSEVQKLKHVETVDKAAPVIEKVHLQENPRPVLNDEILKFSEFKNQYESSVEESKRIPDGIKGKEGADTAELGGLTQKFRDQYQKEVSDKNKNAESTQIVGKVGKNVSYKNLPPKKDLNDLI